MPVRREALALYQACQKSTTQCELDLDLLRDRAIPPDSQNTPRSTSETSLVYHLFFRNAGPKAELWDITAKSFNSSQVATSPAVEILEEPDLAVFRSALPSSSRIIGIHPSYPSDNCYFRVSVPHTTFVPVIESGDLCHELYQNRTSTDAGTPQSISLSAKLDLAYNLVQCGFYLLGTPWLASLSSKRLRRLQTEDHSVCVLEVKTIPLDNLYLDSPEALSESSQLFQIGLILIEIALGDSETFDPEEHEDPYLSASKMLPHVHTALGSKYRRACAFCIQDRRSLSSYGRPQKYQYPEETGWEFYLKELLKEYHVQVVSR